MSLKKCLVSNRQNVKIIKQILYNVILIENSPKKQDCSTYMTRYIKMDMPNHKNIL